MSDDIGVDSLITRIIELNGMPCNALIRIEPSKEGVAKIHVMASGKDVNSLTFLNNESAKLNYLG